MPSVLCVEKSAKKVTRENGFQGKVFCKAQEKWKTSAGSSGRSWGDISFAGSPGGGWGDISFAG